MKRILAYKAKFKFLAGGTSGQGPNVGRNWPGRVPFGKIRMRANKVVKAHTWFYIVFCWDGGFLFVLCWVFCV